MAQRHFLAARYDLSCTSSISFSFRLNLTSFALVVSLGAFFSLSQGND